MEDRPSTYSILRDILGDVNHWLHFAEAKNAALITFDLALIVGIGTIATTGNKLPPHFLDLSFALCLGFTVSALVALASFFPRLVRLVDTEQASGAFTGNVFFYGDLAHTSAELLLNAVYVRTEQTEWSNLETDLANQIVNNSKIAVGKYMLFKYALRIAGAFLLFGLTMLIWGLFR